MNSGLLTPKEKFKQLEKLSDEFKVECNTPIRRYFRSGVEVKRMADTYYDENDLERAYILYYKYVTLFVEKIRQHPEYKSLRAVDKAKVVKTLKVVMPRVEELKESLTVKFEQDYADWLAEDKVRLEMVRKQEEEKRKLKEQDVKNDVIRYHEEKERALAMNRDQEVAMWLQLQIDKEESERNVKPDNRDADSDGIVATFDRGLKPKMPSLSQPPSIPDRSTKPTSWSCDGLRTVVVPTNLMDKFLVLAETNTRANIETGGILAGRLSNNIFRVTHLLIPKQTGTSDSFVTKEDADIEMFEYQDSKHLITLGWIHTHPSQTAFLSSVDLHTHLPYQLLLPEAIALVMAPKFNERRIFVLTPNYGLRFIENCTNAGFHPHPNDPPLFEEASHVELDPTQAVELVDFR